MSNLIVDIQSLDTLTEENLFKLLEMYRLVLKDFKPFLLQTNYEGISGQWYHYNGVHFEKEFDTREEAVVWMYEEFRHCSERYDYDAEFIENSISYAPYWWQIEEL